MINPPNCKSQNKKYSLQKSFILFIFTLFNIWTSLSQCAGADNSVIICDKETDTGLQTYDLFSQLSGTPVAGGEWSSANPANNFALNTTSGEVNLWSINRAGEHQFTYTNPACGDSATVTIFLGGYPGEDNVDGGANACSDNAAVNLFAFLDNDLPGLNVDQNGTWSEDPTTRTGLLTEEFFNAEVAGEGTYTFIYTTDVVETCASEFATVKLEVHRSPEPGVAIDIILCDTDDLSIYTDVNLNDYLIGEDADGIWTDVNLTGQITDIRDSTINIQEIFNTRGNGNYDFEYTVFPKSPVCVEESTIVRVSLPKVSGTFNVQNVCDTEPLTIQIDFTSSDAIPFNFDLEYEIRNTVTDALAYTDTNFIRINPTFPDFEDSFIFSVDPNPLLTPGSYYITVKEITNMNGIICNTLDIADDTFVYNKINYNIDTNCFTGTNAILEISDFYNSAGMLSNETIDIDYTIEDLTNGIPRNIENQMISFTDGYTEIPIDISIFPGNATNFNIRITDPDDIGLNCSDFNFTASLIPEDIELEVLIDNSCDATKVEASIDAPLLGDGNYTITYQVRRIGDITFLIDNSFVTSSITSVLNVDIATLGEGDYEIILKSTQNDTNPCRVQRNFEVIDNFSIGGIPDMPTLDATQTFCLANFHPNQPTIADIAVTTGANLTWYADLTTTTPLATTTILTNNTNYYVTASDPVNSCESSARAVVNIQLTTTDIVNSSDRNPTFCNITTITLANFDATVTAGDLIWYDAATGGNILPETTEVEDGRSYFAVQNIGGCEHHTRLEFIATVITPPNLVVNPNQTFCLSDFQPNQPTIADIVVDEGTNITWYADNSTTTPLNTNTALTDGTSYFVTTQDPTNTCESNRAIVTVRVITTELVTSSDTNPTFCNVTNLTLADFDTTNSTGDLIWYDAATGGNILPDSTPVIGGESYFAVQSIDGCEHHIRLEFSAIVINPPTPVYNGNISFCALEELTLLDLETDITPVSSTFELIWFDAATDGDELSNADIIEEGVSYFVAYVDPTTNCEANRTEIVFNTSVCDPDKYDFFIPDGFSPNDDDTNDQYYIPNIQYFYPKYELEIFNRYGQSLFKGDINKPKWNGQSSTGSEVTSGVYFYILRYNDGVLKPKQGRIYLSK